MHLAKLTLQPGPRNYLTMTHMATAAGHSGPSN